MFAWCAVLGGCCVGGLVLTLIDCLLCGRVVGVWLLILWIGWFMRVLWLTLRVSVLLVFSGAGLLVCLIIGYFGCCMRLFVCFYCMFWFLWFALLWLFVLFSCGLFVLVSFVRTWAYLLGVTRRVIDYFTVLIELL